MCCVCTFKLCAVYMCRVYTYCMYLYGEALISRHLVLRGNSLPGGFWMLCVQYKPKQVVQELAGSFFIHLFGGYPR